MDKQPSGPSAPPPYLALELLAVLGLLVFSPVLSAALVSGSSSDSIGNQPRYLIHATFADLFVCLLLITLVLIRGEKPYRVGLDPRHTSLLHELAIGFGLFIGFVMFTGVTGRLASFGHQLAEALQGASIPVLALFVVHIAINSVYQELLFRGYLITRLESCFSRGVAVVISASFFAILHWGRPPLELAFLFAAGVAFGSLFLWRRNLVKLVIAHTLYNLFAFIASGIQFH